MDWTCINNRKLITKSRRRKNTRKFKIGRNKIFGILSDLIGKKDYAYLKTRAHDRNQWRN